MTKRPETLAANAFASGRRAHHASLLRSHPLRSTNPSIHEGHYAAPPAYLSLPGDDGMDISGCQDLRFSGQFRTDLPQAFGDAATTASDSGNKKNEVAVALMAATLGGSCIGFPATLLLFHLYGNRWRAVRSCFARYCRRPRSRCIRIVIPLLVLNCAGLRQSVCCRAACYPAAEGYRCRSDAYSPPVAGPWAISKRTVLGDLFSGLCCLIALSLALMGTSKLMLSGLFGGAASSRKHCLRS